tara:strand:+ start:26869 stop:27555 length:687 start_codon:yes stop_codon:yes gene_type:complete
VSTIPPIKIRPEGRPFIAIFVVVAALLFSVAQFLGWVGVILIGWCMYFFRDPNRVTPLESGLVISPADGIIQMITDAPPPSELEMGSAPMRRVSVFMNVFDCHVNRIPIDGRIIKSVYRPGKFVNASLDKASEHNERRSLSIHTDYGIDIAVVQIAGLIARRIICWTEESQSLSVGERYGMIRFGSRVDVYLPTGTRILAVPGQRAVAGETPIAQLDDSQDDRKGEWR